LPDARQHHAASWARAGSPQRGQRDGEEYESTDETPWCASPVTGPPKAAVPQAGERHPGQHQGNAREHARSHGLPEDQDAEHDRHHRWQVGHRGGDVPPSLVKIW
jgi:hypothetical protein